MKDKLGDPNKEATILLLSLGKFGYMEGWVKHHNSCLICLLRCFNLGGSRLLRLVVQVRINFPDNWTMNQ